MEHISLTQLLENPDLYNKENYYGFNDWFCKQTTLESEYKKMLPKLKLLAEMGFVDPDRVYVWFINNCPCVGKLYTDIRFSLLDDSSFLGGVVPISGFNSDKEKGQMCSYWRLAPDYEEFIFKNWLDFKKQIKNKPFSIMPPMEE